MDSKFPVEIEVEHQKLSKIEAEFESIFQFIEHESDAKDIFDDTVLNGRAKITSLKLEFSKFQQSCAEWEDLSTYESKIKPLVESNKIVLNSLQNSYSKKFQQSCAEWEDHSTYESKIKPLVESHKVVLNSLQNSYRKACINGQKRLTTLERNQLLRTSSETNDADSKVRKRLIEKSDVAKKSQDIKESMLGIARMMDNQVKVGETSNVVLESSSQKIKETHEELKSLTGIISVSRKLLNKYNRRELTDTLLIFFGLVLFFATCLYIVSKRI